MKEQSLSPSKTRLNNSSSNRYLAKQDSLPARSASLQAKLPATSLSSHNFQIQKTGCCPNSSSQTTKQNNLSSVEIQLKNPLQKSEKHFNFVSHSFNNNSDTINDIPILPSKDAVIKKMKKITKAVQDLFKATKESDFNGYKQK